MNWDDARVFLAVARAGTLSGAAGRLRLGAATVARRIARLEGALDAALFLRRQDGYALTGAGAALFPLAETLERAAAAVAAQAAEAGAARGFVRVATAENLANPILIPALAPLLRDNPGLRVEVATGTATLNLHRGEADLAVRMSLPERGHVVAQRLGTLGFGFYGAAEGPAQGWPETAAPGPARWAAEIAGEAPAMVLGTLAGHLSAAQAGLGPALLPHFLAREAGLAEIKGAPRHEQPIWLAIQADMAETRPVRLVAETLAAAIRAEAGRLAGG